MFGQMGAKIHVNNDDAVASSDVAILAVKPQFLHDTIKSVSTDSWENKLVVSIAAGITLATIEVRSSMREWIYEIELSPGVTIDLLTLHAINAVTAGLPSPLSSSGSSNAKHPLSCW